MAMPRHQELPERFGRYRILDKLGAGGMGAVYLAEDTKLGRKVALKVPHFKPGDGTAILERFRREARLAAGIDHPNFCQVHDVDEVDGIHYFTMAFVEGRPLSDFIGPERPWVPRQAVELVRLIAQVVGLLHGKGIVHRDLKPSNIMLRPSGEPVLMDFGLACALTAESQRLTGTGEVLGTLAYMPPEQLEGDRQRMGPAADVYSLGMILYELLTGRLPFDGPPLALMHQISTKVPEPPSQVRPALDTRLDAICLKALAKKPDERFPDMSTFAAALAEFLSVPAEQRLSCPQCGKALKMPASMAGKRMKCPSCQASLSAATLTQPRPVPEQLETMPTSNLHRAARPPPKPTPTCSPGPPGRGKPHLRVVLAVSLATLLVGGTLIWWAFRKDGESDGLPSKFTNTLKMQMVLIPEGTFQMGSLPADKDKGAEDNELYQHPVRVPRRFYMAATEVTRGQFRQFVKENNYQTDAEKVKKSTSTWQKNDYSKEDNQPVVNVSWNDAMAFCQWLSEKEGKKYELPTEAEWEYACRAGGKPGDVYCFGNDLKELGDYAWFNDNSGGKTHPVGTTKKANRWGLFDMHGNVWEWCADSPRKYPTKEEVEKLKDPIEDYKDPQNTNIRALRGGAWGDLVPRYCRSASRFNFAREDCYNFLGFRVVLRPGERAP